MFNKSLGFSHLASLLILALIVTVIPLTAYLLNKPSGAQNIRTKAASLSSSPPKTIASGKFFPKSAVLTDLNMDGTNEIIIASNLAQVDGNYQYYDIGKSVDAYNADGQLLWTYPFQNNDYIQDRADIAVGDIDKDGYPEIVFTTGRTSNPNGSAAAIYVLDHNGKPKPGWPYSNGLNRMSNPILVDLNNDGYKEIVLNGYEDLSTGGRIQLLAYRYDHTFLWSRNVGDDTFRRMAAIHGSATADLDQPRDGKPEIVTSYIDSTGNANIAITRSDGSDFNVSPLTSYQGNHGITAPIITDINADGISDIVVNTGNQIKVLYVYTDSSTLTHYLTNVPGWPVSLPYPIQSKVTDFENDGQLEIVSVVPSFGTDISAVYAHRSNGQMVSGFPIRDSQIVSDTDQLLIADLDGDGTKDMLYPTQNCVFKAVNSRGAPLTNFPIQVNSSQYCTFVDSAVGDITSSHQTGLLSLHNVWDEIAKTTTSFVYLTNLGSNYNSQLADWPINRHDLFRTNSYNNPPVSIFNATPTTGISPLTVTLTNKSYDPNGNPITYYWKFGDGQTSTSQYPGTHIYSLPAGSIGQNYSLSLTVTDSYGLSATTATPISVKPNHPPIANFNFSPAIAWESRPVTFTNLSKDPDGDPLTYTWDFGDGSTSTLTSPSHSFIITTLPHLDSQNFLVKLTVKDSRGASATYTATVPVNSILRNSSMETDTNLDLYPDFWTTKRLDTDKLITGNYHDGQKSWRFTPSSGGLNEVIMQTASVSGTPGEAIALSVWNLNPGTITSGQTGAIITVFNTTGGILDGTTTSTSTTFRPANPGWEESTLCLPTYKSYASIKVTLFNSNSSTNYLLDQLHLTAAPGSCPFITPSALSPSTINSIIN